jgi:hypothetical protein
MVYLDVYKGYMNKSNFKILLNKKLDEFVGRTDDKEIIKQDMLKMISQLAKKYPQYIYYMEQIIKEGIKNGNGSKE